MHHRTQFVTGCEMDRLNSTTMKSSCAKFSFRTGLGLLFSRRIENTHATGEHEGLTNESIPTRTSTATDHARIRPAFSPGGSHHGE